jgi:hypothetical protein
MTEEEENEGNPFQWLSERGMLPAAMDPAADIRLNNIKVILEVIKNETRPIEGHTDPAAIEDCWKDVFEKIDDLA